MAVVKGDINKDTVDAFRGSVDFFKWKGLTVARSWPRKPKQPGTPEQRAGWEYMRRSRIGMKLMSERDKAALIFRVMGSGWTWVDWFTSQFLTASHRSKQPAVTIYNFEGFFNPGAIYWQVDTTRNCNVYINVGDFPPVPGKWPIDWSESICETGGMPLNRVLYPCEKFRWRYLMSEEVVLKRHYRIIIWPTYESPISFSFDAETYDGKELGKSGVYTMKKEY